MTASKDTCSDPVQALHTIAALSAAEAVPYMYRILTFFQTSGPPSAKFLENLQFRRSPGKWSSTDLRPCNVKRFADLCQTGSAQLFRVYFFHDLYNPESA